jgi:phage N-6-adenine-methyltransferase
LPVSPVMFSSASDEWETPQDLFDRLHGEFRFAVDLAASGVNAKVRYAYFTKELDALGSEWTRVQIERPVGFCNPPYSRGLQGKFISKAAQERRRGFTTVMLLPARTDTKAFHTHIYDASTWQARPGVEIRLLPGRLKFGGAVNGAPFPSMIVIFRPGVS